MSKIAVIGDRESIYGYAALGLDIYYTDFSDGEEKEIALLKKLAQSQNYSIIFITEAAAALLSKEIEKYKSQPSPAIILIPGVAGNTGEGLSAVRASVEKAVGSDIFND